MEYKQGKIVVRKYFSFNISFFSVFARVLRGRAPRQKRLTIQHKHLEIKK